VVDNQTNYKVFVVRCWDEQNSQADASVCRFSLEIPSTGQRFGFVSLEALMKVLELRLSQGSKFGNNGCDFRETL
jgi:hypothetical protein